MNNLSALRNELNTLNFNDTANVKGGCNRRARNCGSYRTMCNQTPPPPKNNSCMSPAPTPDPIPAPIEVPAYDVAS